MACGPSAPGDRAGAADATGGAAQTTPVVVANRIVSLAPAFTEMLLAIGAGDAIVGIGTFDPPVPGRPDVPRLGDAFTASREAVLGLRPDLVLVNAKAVADSLRAASPGLLVVAPPTDRLDDVLAIVEDLGRRTGHVAEATELLTRIRESIAAARTRAAARRDAGSTPPRVLVVVQRRPLYAAGRTSYVAELLRTIGAANAVDDVEEPWPLVSEEAAVARAPDVILDASEGDNATPEGRAALLASWRRFASMPAVRNDRVLVIREDAIFRAGPRIPEALTKLEALVWGEAVR